MPDEWRLTVRLKSRRVLKQFMDYQQIRTGYALAKKAGILPGTAQHLVSGRRNSCSPATAAAIEEALGCPVGFLFERSMSRLVLALGDHQADTLRADPDIYVRPTPEPVDSEVER